MADLPPDPRPSPEDLLGEASTPRAQRPGRVKANPPESPKSVPPPDSAKDRARAGSSRDAAGTRGSSLEDLRRLALRAATICEELERGLASRPLSEHLRALAEEPRGAPFCVVALGLTVSARGALLGWLCGQDPKHFTVHVPDQVGMVEVSFSERGFVLEKAGHGRFEFDCLDPFLEAMRAADLVRHGDADSWIDPLSMRLPGGGGVQGLRLLMPENLTALRESSGLIAHLGTRSNLLIVAADGAVDLSPPDRETLADLAATLGVVVPVLVAGPKGRPSASALPMAVLAGARRIEPLQSIAYGGASELPPLFADPADPLRRALFAAHHGRRLLDGIAMIEHQLESEQLKQSTRAASLGRRLKAGEEQQRGGGTSRPLEGARLAFVEEFAQLNKGIEERSRRALLPEGALHAQAKSALAELRPSDLSGEPGVGVIKLRVDEAFLGHLADNSRRALRTELSGDLRLLRDGLVELRRQVSEATLQAGGVPIDLDLQPPDEALLWGSLEEQTQLELRYRGELPKRGFVQRLSDGRKPVYLIMMMSSLVGKAVGLDTGNSLIGIAMLVIFVIGFVSTFRSWKTQDAERIGKELDRVRDQLDNELRKVLSDVSRDKGLRMASHLNDLQRAGLREFDRVEREVLLTKQKSLDSGRSEERLRLKQAEGRLEGLGRLSETLAGLRNQIDAWYQSALSALEARG
jgi:hypothetical protein